jgi:DNA-binding NarL/FixJ family response regulator
MTAVTAPGANLTDTELAVVRLVSMGRTDAQISQHLVISVSAIEACLRGAYDKTGANDRAQLTRWLLDGPRGDWPPDVPE